MVDRLFEQARLVPPECPVSLVRDNLEEITSSDITSFEVVRMAGQLATNQFEPGAERDMIALINDYRIWRPRQPISLSPATEARK